MARNGPKPSHPKDRFWKHVSPGSADECWEWQGARQRLGYGHMLGGPFYPTKWAKAHRVSWEIHNGPIPEGVHVLHHCDNPPCCNPGHLYLGGPTENARDRGERRRGRESRDVGEAHPRHKLTEADVKAIDALLATNLSQERIAELFGVKQPLVSRIKNREVWRHLWKE